MARIPAANPDVAVLDVRLPDGKWHRGCAEICCRACAELRCLI
ncbi:hypothetical protein I545_3036 [Mycobacterium kansasii 662]|uniref:Uncharacterized protein n=1 Tax=Mycobacterium kansasii 662 TaxID=1299326 RepID=X7ZGC7_MYCKA|nr:hypothetical protein I545_3036 [Mycobacterium kansasii 662]